MIDGVFLASVFMAGMSSFLMPCIIPLVPAYLAYLTGKTVSSNDHSSVDSKLVLFNALGFVFGFIFVFVLLGAAATAISRLLISEQDLFRKIAGMFIIFMGLFHMGLIPLKFLNYERRMNLIPSTATFTQSLLLGLGFGLGWSPCLGPVLASILIIASQTETVGMGVLLLSVYGLGLGIPFLALALGFKAVWKYVYRIQKYSGIIKKVTGAILVLVGILIFFNKLMIFAF